MKWCPNCKTFQPNDKRYCPDCGVELERNEVSSEDASDGIFQDELETETVPIGHA